MTRSGSRSQTVAVLSAYVVARAVGFHILFLSERQLYGTRLIVRQPFHTWQQMLLRWDAGYYKAIAETGYPAALPTSADGAVLQNHWAFFPLFPFLARVVAALTRLPFETAAVVLNVLVGAGAAVLITQVVGRFSSEDRGWRASVLWSFFPTAFVLQVPYSEALYLALTAGCLLAILTERWLSAAALLIASSLCRAFVLPVSIAALWSVASAIRSRGPASWRPMTLGVIALAAPFVWMTVAAIATGRPDAYSATQSAWGYSYSVTERLNEWAAMATRHHMSAVDWAVTATLLAATAAAIMMLVQRKWPIELKLYAAAATGFLWLAALPGAVGFSSVPRFAFSILTLPMALAQLLSSRIAFACTLAVFLALQYLWVLNIWSGRIGIAP